LEIQQVIVHEELAQDEQIQLRHHEVLDTLEKERLHAL
jgi:hypothetical protein